MSSREVNDLSIEIKKGYHTMGDLSSADLIREKNSDNQFEDALSDQTVTQLTVEQLVTAIVSPLCGNRETSITLWVEADMRSGLCRQPTIKIAEGASRSPSRAYLPLRYKVLGGRSLDEQVWNRPRHGTHGY